MPTVPLLGDVADLASSQTAQVTVPLMPTGSVISYAGSTAPSGWLLCDGASLSTSAYPTLFAIIGYSFGGSGGSFNLPDLRGRFVRYDDNMGNHGIAGVTATGAASRDTGRVHGSSQTQTTAKNGISGTAAGQTQGASNISLASGSAAGQSVTVTGLKNQFDLTGGGSHSHVAPIVRMGPGTIRTADWEIPSTNDGVYGSQPSSVNSQSHNHSWSGNFTATGTASSSTVTGTTNIAHTHAASALTVTGDVETRPINLSLNAIIKI